jgi:hypothetical protein
MCDSVEKYSFFGGCMKKIAFWNVVLFCGVCGLELNPDSITISSNLIKKISGTIDTIIIKNTGESAVSIDSVKIMFLNGDSFDLRSGKNCADFSCYNYSGWSYGMSQQVLHYLHDSLFLLEDVSGNLLKYTIQPHDSVKFPLWSVINCPVCGRMPSFPTTTRFRFDFVGKNGMCDTFFLNVQNPTPIVYNANQKRDHTVLQQSSSVNLRGQTIFTPHSTQITSIKGKKLLNIKNSTVAPKM